ncbi:MAG: thiamine-phosphate kinase, partial [Bryobacteraceae bacterium]
MGDDAAVLRATANEMILSSDQFLEGVHFLGNVHPAEGVGYKSLARAVSDLAAMGATPRFFLMNLALPADRTGGANPVWLNGFLGGMRRASAAFDIQLIGGDTAEARSISIGITVGGQMESGKALLRSGAHPGDLLYVSGVLGAAQLGLDLILRASPASRARRLLRAATWRGVMAAHLYPRPQLELGQWLAVRGRASAAIDTSDGLSTDLAHLCDASGVAARIWAEQIPAVRIPP